MSAGAGAQTILLINRGAGAGRAGRLWDRLLDDPGLEGEVVCAGSPAQASASLEGLLGPGTRRIIAFGGDGTFHHLVNEVMARGLAGQVEVGLVPLGTGCDLARTLGLPRRPREALRHLRRCRARPLDLLRVELDGAVLYAANIASLGLSGDVARIVNHRARRGVWTYLSVAIRQLLGTRPRDSAVELDGAPWFSGPLWLLAVANGPRFARGMRIAPGALVDDGIADCVVVSAPGPWPLMAQLPALYLGRHLNSRHVHWARGREVVLRDGDGGEWQVELDGEPRASRVFRVAIVPGAIRVLC